MNQDNIEAIKTITDNCDIFAIMDARKRDPRTCDDCGEPTQFWDEQRGIPYASSCRCQRRAMRHRSHIDNGIPESYLDTDLTAYVAQAEGLVERRVTALINIRDRYIGQLPKLLADDNNGHRIQATVGGKEKRFNSLIIHLDDVEAARHMATDIAKAHKGPKVAYYSFPEIVAVIGDFSRTEEQRDLTHTFRTIPLLVIDGVERGRYNDHVTQRWSALITQRHFSGKPTVVVALDEPKSSISSRQWSAMVDDALLVAATLREGVEETNVDAPPVDRAANRAPLTNADEVEEAILSFVGREGTPVYSKIVAGVNADKALIGKVLDSLVAEKALAKFEKVGKNGTFTVYRIVEEDDRKAPATSDTQNCERMTLRELEAATGRLKGTLSKWRSKGLTDAEIIEKSKSE